MDQILRTHLIEPQHLRNDDFDAFFESRIKALAGLIADSMGKAVVEEHGSNEAEVEVPVFDMEMDEEGLRKCFSDPQPERKPVSAYSHGKTSTEANIR